MVTLSLGMIVKNEEKTLDRILTAAKTFCDEIVVVDTGSTDGTLDIIKRHGVKLYHFDWIDDFAAARNYAFSLCTGDWIMWLDADDVLPPEEQAKILDLKNTQLNDSIDMVFLSYHFWVNESNEVLLSMPRERIVRRKAGLKWVYKIHECIAYPQGTPTMNALEIGVYHQPIRTQEILERKHVRNLGILQQMVDAGERTPHVLFHYSEELLHANRFEDAISAIEEYLEKSQYYDQMYSAYISLGRIYERMNNLEKAKESYGRGIAWDPEKLECYNGLAKCFIDQSKYEKAYAILKGTLHLNSPRNLQAGRQHYFMRFEYLSQCSLMLGRLDESFEYITKDLDKNPDKPRAISIINHLVSQLSGRLQAPQQEQTGGPSQQMLLGGPGPQQQQRGPGFQQPQSMTR